MALSSDRLNTGYDKLPRMYPEDTCYNVTPDYIFTKTGCHIFKYSESCEVYTADHVGNPTDTNFGFAHISLARKERLAEITADNGEISIMVSD